MNIANNNPSLNETSAPASSCSRRPNPRRAKRGTTRYLMALLQRAEKAHSHTRWPPPASRTPSPGRAGTDSSRPAAVRGWAGRRTSGRSGYGEDAGTISSMDTSKFLYLFLVDGGEVGDAAVVQHPLLYLCNVVDTLEPNLTKIESLFTFTTPFVVFYLHKTVISELFVVFFLIF